MLRYHMAVVTADIELKRAIKRLTTASGSSADFLATSASLKPERHADLAIFDARDAEPNRRFLDNVAEDASILYIVRGESLIDRVHLLDDPRVTSLFFHDQRFDDNEFICSATKALRHDAFGLQKYFPWGVTTYTMTISNYAQKGRAIDILMHYAKLAGVRGSVRDRIQLVADELIMNAMYHAPTDAQGKERFRDKTVRELAHLDYTDPVQVQYGCSGDYFGIAVRDAGGSLSRPRALEYLKRAKTGWRIEDKSTGAGLGLISVLHSVSKLIFNLDPGHSTEVIGLFDMELFAKGKVGARSLHIFSEGPAEPEEEYDEVADEDLIPVGRPPLATAWLLVAFLSVTVAVLATAYYNRKPASAAVETRSLTVTTEPANATIHVDGNTLASGDTVPISPNESKLMVRVTLEGYRPWARSYETGDLGSDSHIFVDLVPKP